jgi:hypothetical protein
MCAMPAARLATTAEGCIARTDAVILILPTWTRTPANTSHTVKRRFHHSAAIHVD